MKPVYFNGRTRGGFTLLELLAAMAILAIMVTLLFAAFGQASRAWLLAENRVETFTQARAALDFMSRELSQAIATSNISFLGNATNVAFVAPVSTDPANLVDLEEVVYRRNNQTARLERQVTPFSAGTLTWDFYSRPQAWPDTVDSTVPLADNIVWLKLSYVDASGNTIGPPSFWNSTPVISTPWAAGQAGTATMTNRAPAGVQIEIGAIDSRAATRLQAIAPGGTNAANVGPYTNMVKQATKYFTTFVAIPNRQP